MSQSYVIVEGAGALFAVPQAQVREIVPARQITRLPGAPASVRGLLNVRGTLVTVVDLATRFGRGKSVGDDPSVVIAVTESRTLGLLVDDVLDVQAYSAADFVAATVEPADKSLVGMGHFGDRIVLAVDLQELARQTLA
ncbi:MAG: purine-binding chemotaxis protein CheW [Gemmatimonadetes bacterium]|nr:purine-binding chemotaxis protein CheW [Gemmatimonadota bacterium]MBP9105571.1 purine-binding chemotaxis protein CheW [Gemmatimonadaceae bacterium]MBK6842260.1 purine-binding chemotaxis protein CheW [Gemmatimonadota bacterium]MBK9407858.1 purine-binding chemotaxis protein CheW [Gemmatimonadota bacterium]MBK9979122.1 purine-binding chemotaxis protein CheW [Gemmatimonadota bacterium]